ncbi:carboxylesterase/lipase family protein [Mycolicibacterium canariasense]|uniref:carboxylesterase/lipase family protein n=1 Tax=Mycolicibacterium canariasense TaxID=228230 RepID=UPI000789A2A2|nr:carboxylesterase family protein [Mycolicibacterium canariasense]MCV7211288.1 carboxylesterase family protein [Mycolicibacterium canariasense]ORV03746.1 carboxylesterase [Mycolicibacterium canariasense]
MLSGPVRRRWSGAVARLLAVLAIGVVVLGGCARGAGQTADTSQVPTPDPRLDNGVVHLADGQLQGAVASGYVLFQGIPYAAPPVGALRWQPPAPVRPWTGVRDATLPRPRCVQDTSRDPGWGRKTAEDCLTLNVWVPSGAAGLPVMFWIHGGAFLNGSGDLYGSRWLATTGRVIVVTVNYRLGAPGFLAHPGVGDGNYGLADQQAALRWVHENIGAFGGDPAKVTIAGESAGAMSVCDHLVAPGSAGLFRAAIIQSGPCQAQADLATAHRESLRYAARVGCADPADAARCLRALPAAELDQPPWFYRIGNDWLTGPTTGTPVLPGDPVTLIRDGKAAKVPVLIGTNRDEFTLFVALQYLRTRHVSTPADYPGLLADTFGADGPAVGERYPLARFGGSTSLAYAAAVTDGVFACVAHRMATDLARAAPVFGYEFDDPAPPTPDPLRQLPFPVGASHSLELRYLFEIGGAPPLDAAQQRLSDQMLSYWTQFITTGVPAAPGGPIWPPVNEGSDPWMQLRPDGSRMVTDFAAAHQCPFWAGLKG